MGPAAISGSGAAARTASACPDLGTFINQASSPSSLLNPWAGLLVDLPWRATLAACARFLVGNLFAAGGDGGGIFRQRDLRCVYDVGGGSHCFNLARRSGIRRRCSLPEPRDRRSIAVLAALGCACRLFNRHSAWSYPPVRDPAVSLG